jgi:hypothetical protein
MSASKSGPVTPVARFADCGRGGGVVVETLGAFPNDAAANETFHCSQIAMVLRSREADGIADGVGATGAANAVDIVFGVHRKIEVHNV